MTYGEQKYIFHQEKPSVPLCSSINEEILSRSVITDAIAASMLTSSGDAIVVFVTSRCRHTMAVAASRPGWRNKFVVSRGGGGTNVFQCDKALFHSAVQ